MTRKYTTNWSINDVSSVLRTLVFCDNGGDPRDDDDAKRPLVADSRETGGRDCFASNGFRKPFASWPTHSSMTSMSLTS